MGRSDEQWEFLKDIAKLIVFAEKRGYKLTGGECYRPDAMQLLYYYGKNIRNVDGELVLIGGPTRTQTLDSAHGKRMAQDFNIFYDIDGDGDKDYLGSDADKTVAQELGDFWASLHPLNRSGFDWGWDLGHFERMLA